MLSQPLLNPLPHPAIYALIWKDELPYDRAWEYPEIAIVVRTRIVNMTEIRSTDRPSYLYHARKKTGALW
jgi:hypothetical protein